MMAFMFRQTAMGCTDKTHREQIILGPTKVLSSDLGLRPEGRGKRKKRATTSGVWRHTLTVPGCILLSVPSSETACARQCRRVYFVFWLANVIMYRGAWAPIHAGVWKGAGWSDVEVEHPHAAPSLRRVDSVLLGPLLHGVYTS